MKDKILEILVCPLCGESLRLANETVVGDDISEGVLECDCQARFVVCGGIPRMLPRNLFFDRDVFHRLGVSSNAHPVSWDDRREEWKQEQTSTSFHVEWEKYDNFGWDDTEASYSDSMKWFFQKTMLNVDEIEGKLLLDAGCGNGRYSRVPLEHGAEVVSMDLGRQVELACENLKRAGLNPNGVQGDILHTPFRKDVFDAVYTIGVIQHTGDPIRATRELGTLVRPEGLLSIRAYRRGNDRLEENDARIRSVTTLFTPEELDEFSDILHRLSGFLTRKGLFLDVAKHINIFERKHDIFDWYAAPVADKMTYREFRECFSTIGFSVLRDADTGVPLEERKFDAISIVGKKA